MNFLTQSVDTCRSLLQSVPGPLVVVNADGGILFCNFKACSLFGYTQEQLRSLSIVKLLPDWFTLPPLGVVLESNVVDSEGLTFAVEVSLAPVETDDGPVIIALLRDLSRQKLELATYTVKNENLLDQIEELRHRQRDIGAEMNRAAAILESHLPSEQLSVPGLEVSWRFSPCHTLGGDMVKLFPVSVDLVGFCVLDVSGHGLPASLLAISLARSFSMERTRGGILVGPKGLLRPPKEILSKLNAQYQIFHEGDLFVTLLYGILNLSKRTVRYASAGHPHPWLLSSGGVRALEGPINPPVGVVHDLKFEEAEMKLAPGDKLFVFTDGVTETRSLDGEMYGEARLQQFLFENREANLSTIHQRLYEGLRAFRSDALQTDDITSLILRIPDDEH